MSMHYRVTITDTCLQICTHVCKSSMQTYCVPSPLTRMTSTAESDLAKLTYQYAVRKKRDLAVGYPLSYVSDSTTSCSPYLDTFIRRCADVDKPASRARRRPRVLHKKSRLGVHVHNAGVSMDARDDWRDWRQAECQEVRQRGEGNVSGGRVDVQHTCTYTLVGAVGAAESFASKLGVLCRWGMGGLHWGTYVCRK